MGIITVQTGGAGSPLVPKWVPGIPTVQRPEFIPPDAPTIVPSGGSVDVREGGSITMLPPTFQIEVVSYEFVLERYDDNDTPGEVDPIETWSFFQLIGVDAAPTFTIPASTADSQLSLLCRGRDRAAYIDASGRSGRPSAYYRSDATDIIASLDAPAFTVRAAITGTPEVGEVLTCDGGTITGTPTPDEAFQWVRAGEDIPGATAATYTLVAADDQKPVACRCIATNIAGSATSTSEPLFVTTPTITWPSELVEGVDYTVVETTDTTGVIGTRRMVINAITFDSATFIPVRAASGSPITSFDGSSATFNPAGQTIDFTNSFPVGTVRYHAIGAVLRADTSQYRVLSTGTKVINGTGYPAATVVIQGASVAPSFSGAPSLAPASQVEYGTDLVITQPSVAGTLPITLSNLWYKNGTLQGTTALTYRPVAGDLNAVFSVETKATNSKGTTTSARSNAVTVIAPTTGGTVPVPTSTPALAPAGEVVRGNPIIATPATFTGNPVPTKTHVWYRGNGHLDASITTATYTPRDTAITLSIASPCVLTLSAHGMVANEPFRLKTSGVFPAGVTTKAYFVKTVLDANRFTFSEQPDGPAINTSGTQSGTHYMTDDGTTFTYATLGTNSAGSALSDVSNGVLVTPPTVVGDPISQLGIPANANFYTQAAGVGPIGLSGNTMTQTSQGVALLAIGTRAIQGYGPARTELASRLNYTIGPGNGSKNPPMNGAYCENTGNMILALAGLAAAHTPTWNSLSDDMQERVDLLMTVAAVSGAITNSDSNFNSGTDPVTITGWNQTGNLKGGGASGVNLDIQPITMAMISMCYFGGPANWEAKVAASVSTSGRSSVAAALNAKGMTELRRTWLWNSIGDTTLQGHRGGPRGDAPSDAQIRSSVNLNAAQDAAQVQWWGLRMSSYKAILRAMTHVRIAANKDNCCSINCLISRGWEAKGNSSTQSPMESSLWKLGDPVGLPINAKPGYPVRSSGKQPASQADPPGMGLHGGWGELYAAQDAEGGRADMEYSLLGYRSLIATWLVMWCYGYIDKNDTDIKASAVIFDRCVKDFIHKNTPGSVFLSFAHGAERTPSASSMGIDNFVFKLWTEVLGPVFGF